MSSPGSGIYGLLLAMTAQRLGFPPGRRRRRRWPTRWPPAGAPRRARSCCGTRVERVLVRDGRRGACGPPPATRCRARAVLADVTAPALYGGLVPWDDLPARTRRLMRLVPLGPGHGQGRLGAVRSGAVGRRAVRGAPGRVHVAESVGRGRAVPARARGGRRALAAVPARRADGHHRPDPGAGRARSRCGPTRTCRSGRRPTPAAAAITGAWDDDDSERMADRMQARVEEYAPGFGDRVVARRVLGPRELEARDENLRRRRAQRRHGGAAPAAGAAAGARVSAGRDAGEGAVPRVVVGAPRRRGARRVRRERRPRGAAPGPLTAGQLATVAITRERVDRVGPARGRCGPAARRTRAGTARAQQRPTRARARAGQR